MKNIDLNLDVELEYDYESPYNNPTPAGIEYIPGLVTINSVKCNGIEIISLISKDYLDSMQEEILEEKTNQ